MASQHIGRRVSLSCAPFTGQPGRPWAGLVGLLVIVAFGTRSATADLPITLASQWGGPCLAVAVKDNLACVGIGHRLAVLDLSDPTHPALVGQTDPMPSVVQGVAARDHYAYVADTWNGLLIVDIANPAQPVMRGSCDTDGESLDVFVVDDYAYVADGGSGLQIINISDPDSPYREGVYDTSGQARAVTVVGNLAYVADGPGGLQIIDIQDPANPSLVSDYTSLPDEASGVAVAGNYAYVGDGNSGGLQIVNITDPANPAPAGSCGTDGSAGDVVVLGTFAYVANGWNDLAIIDVSDPNAPFKAGGSDADGWGTDIALSGGYAFLADASHGLQVIDVSNPPTAIWASEYREASGEVTDVASLGDYLYISDGGAGGGVQVMDVSDPTRPSRLAGVFTHEFAWGLTATDNHVYLADGCAGLGIVDVADPNHPQRRGAVNSGCAARDVAAEGHYAYVANDRGILHVIDVADPDAPVLKSNWQDNQGQGWALGVAVAGTTVYLADGALGLQIIDVSDPNTPVRLGRYDPIIDVHGVAVRDQYAYVADRWLGLIIVDVADPQNPAFVGRCDVVASAEGVVVQGHYAYMAGGDQGLQIVDISDPAAPVRVGQYDTAGYALDVAVAGDTIYIADWDNGLVIVKVNHDYVWNDPFGGDFILAEKWDPPGPPGPDDRAIFNLPASYTTTMPADADVTNDRLLANGGEVQLDLSGRTYSLQHGWDGTPSVAVADDPDAEATASLTVFNGTVAAHELELGRWANNAGTLVLHECAWLADDHFFDIGVRGEGFVTLYNAFASHRYGWLGFDVDSRGELTVSNPATSWTVAEDLVIGRAGTGTMTVQNEGVAQAGRCVLGELSEGDGAATIETYARLNLQGDNETNLIIGNEGRGTVTVQNYGAVTNAGHIHVAERPDGQGQLTIIDGGLVNVSGAVAVGVQRSTGTVEVRGADSYLTVTGRGAGYPEDSVGIELGQAGAHGILRIEDHGQVSSDYIVNLGGFGDGALGEATVDGSGSLLTCGFQFGVGRDAPGALTVQNGGEVSVTSTLADGSATIGLRSRGDTLVTGTDSSFTTDGITRIGAESSGIGVVTVTEHGSLTSNHQLQVGYHGQGTLEVSAGGRVASYKGPSVSGSSGLIGLQPTSVGTATVRGTSPDGIPSSWIQDGALTVGWFGHGTLNLEDGARIECAHAIVGRMTGSIGSATLKGDAAVWSISGSLSVGGTSDAAGGTGTVTLVNDDHVRVGQTLTLWSGGQVVIQGGRMAVGGDVLGWPGTLFVWPGGTVRGAGTITAGVHNAGGHVAPGTSPGILHIDGSYNTMEAASAVDIELRGTTAGSDYDQLAVTGLAQLDGLLNVTLTGNFTPAYDDAFVILTAAQVSGVFANAATKYTLGDHTFDVIYSPTAVTLTHYVAAPPAITAAVSRKTHGSAGDFDIKVFGLIGGLPVEGRSAGPTRIIVTFDKPIRQVSGTLADVHLPSGTVTGLTVNGSTLDIAMTGVADAFMLGVSFPGISDAADPHAVVTERLCLGTLVGDANGDRTTNILDLVTIRNALNQTVTTSNFRSDVNADAGINILDLVTVRNNLNKTISGPCQ